MFISRKKWDELNERVDTLERYAHNDFEALKSQKRSIKEIRETVGVEAPTVMDSLIMRHFLHPFGYDERDEPKKLTLVEKVAQIMDIVGIEVRHTRQSTKLVRKPAPKAAPAKKASKK